MRTGGSPGLQIKSPSMNEAFDAYRARSGFHPALVFPGGILPSPEAPEIRSVNFIPA